MCVENEGSYDKNDNVHNGMLQNVKCQQMHSSVVHLLVGETVLHHYSAGWRHCLVLHTNLTVRSGLGQDLFTD